MVRVLRVDDEKLLTYGSSITFDNRFLTTVSPQATSQGVMHAGLIIQNLDPVSGARGKQPAVWDGLWTGLNVLQLLTGLFAGKPRAFAFTFNVTESKIELYEILASANPLYSDNEDTPITQVFESAALFRDDIKPKYQMVSLRNGEFSLSEVQGPVYIRLYYKSDQSCWVPWHAFGICSSVDSEPQYFPRLSLGEPTSDYCDAIVNSPLRDGYTFQFRFEITGKCRFVHARFMAAPIPTPQFRAPLCEPIGECQDRDCQAITGVSPFSDLTIYNLQDRLYFNGTPLSFIENCPTGYYCPPGLFPKTFTYPPGTFSIWLPPPGSGFPIVLTKQGCESSVSVSLPATATAAQIQAAGANVIAQVAAQQARCDAILISGPRLPAVISLSALPTSTCEDSVFIAAIHATGGTAPYTFTSPDLPAWMSASSSTTTTTLSGTPPTIGSYTFTINVTSPGANGSRTYTLDVVGIATNSLANGEKDTPYSETLTAPSIPGTLVWSVSDSSLPPGLSLDPGTGEIYGTPTVEDTYAFEITASNGTIACSKDFTLEIESAFDCLGNPETVQDAIWAQSAFGAQPPCGIITATAGSGTFSMTYNMTTCLNQSFVVIETTICNPGDPYDITINVPWDDSGNVAIGVHTIQLTMNINGVTVATDTKDLVSGPFDPFILMGTLPTGAAIPVSMQIVLLATPSPEVVVFSNGAFTVTPLTPP